MYLLDRLHRHPRLPQDGGGSLGGVKAEAQLYELLGDVCDFRLIRVPDGNEHPTLFIQLVARRHKALEQRLLHGVGDTQNLPGRFHLRTKLGVQVRQLFKGEDRDLYRVVGGHFVQPGPVSHVRELFPQHSPRRQVHHGHPRHLADIGDGPGGSGVDLNDIQLPVVD